VFVAFVVVTVVAAACNVAAAAIDFGRVGWILENMSKYGVPRSWLFPLGAAKAAGALGLLVGLAVPAIGTAAAVGLTLFFTGAVVTVARSRWYSHLPFPATFLVLAVAALVLRVATP